MTRFALIFAVLGIFMIGDAASAFAASLLGDLEHGMKKIERKLCSELPSTKCKVAKPALKAKAKVKPHVPEKALPVKKTPLKNGAPDTSHVTIPKAPAAPAPTTAPDLASPILPINKPKSAGKTQPDQTKSSVNPPVPPLKIASPPQILPDKKPAAASLPATVGDLPVAPLPLNPPKSVTQSVPPLPPVVPPVVSAPAPSLTAPTAPLATASAVDSGCLAALAKLGTSFAPVPQPSSSASCQIQTPVQLHSIASKSGSVKLPDQPTVNCAFALRLSSWVDQRVQDLAQKEAGSSVTAMGTGPGFDCRGRNGDFSVKMSEHAQGDAVDIGYMTLANKGQILVKDSLDTQSPHFAFLRDVRAAACVDFATVLGPGANAAHVAHFHIDLEQRRGGFRLCE